MKKKSRILMPLAAIICLMSIAICSLIFQRCQKNDNNVDYNVNNLEFENPMNFVGQYHNKGLEYIIQNYKHSDLNLKSFPDTTEQIILLLNDFIKTIPQESILYNCNVFNKDMSNIMSQKLIDTNAKKLKSASKQLTEEQKSYIDRLKKLLRNQNGIDHLKVFKSVSKLENEIWQSSMTEYEKYTILVAASVGKYSWKFWSQTKLSKPDSPRLKSANAEDDTLTWQELKVGALDADIDGAITGMITGCLGGVIWGTGIIPGVGTLTACILESVQWGFYGAVINSSLYAVKTLWNEYF